MTESVCKNFRDVWEKINLRLLSALIFNQFLNCDLWHKSLYSIISVDGKT